MRHLSTPLALAVIVSLANAVKPVVVDDAAYLAFARQAAAHPLHPYGFTIFWYTVPEPAMQVLCPPVVPYWLAAGMRLFGESVPLLKLWMFPFMWLFAWSLRELLRRFARGTEGVVLPLVVLSPAVLPMVNVMLDIPAAAFGLAALATLDRARRRGSGLHLSPHARMGGEVGGAATPGEGGGDSTGVGGASPGGEVLPPHPDTKRVRPLPRRGVGGEVKPRANPALVVLAGLLAALALQTKCTALVVPPLLLWYGFAFRCWRPSLVAVGVATAGFAAWEALIAAKYGHSHFLLHATNQSPGGGTWAFAYEKLSLLPPLAGHLGCLAVGLGFFAGRAVGVPRRWVLRAAAFWVVGSLLVMVLPLRWAVIVPGKDELHEKLTLAGLVWRTTGAGLLLTMLGAAVRLLVRRGWRWRRSRASLFVVGWVLLELAAYFALTPFPAARRVVGPTVALAVLAARVVCLTRVRPERWVVPTAIAFCLVVAAIDTWDAYPEKVLAERAKETIPAGGRAWFAGHWGFQFYCERGGMRPLVPGESRAEVGDYLVLPAYPDAVRFYRPHIGNVPMVPPAECVDVVAELVSDDWLAAQTVPNFYGGFDPIAARGAARLRVVVYRVVKPWAVPK